MYNNKQKTEYINETGLKNPMERLFERSDELENHLGKDVCEFSEEELILLLRTLEYYNIKTLDNELSKIVSYKKWCKNNGIKANIESVSKENRMECLKPSEKILPFEVFMRGIEKLPNAENIGKYSITRTL